MLELNFIKKGDFFELTGENSRKVAEVLGMPLVENYDGNKCVAIAFYRFDEYADELTAAGYTVRIGLNSDGGEEQ